MPSTRSSRLLRTVCYTLLLGGLLPFGPACDRALAQAPAYEVHPDYLVKHFTVEDGLPVNTITGFVQARDGYLWMTTFDGFVRFDGEHFTVFNTENSPGITSNRFHNLVEDGDGALWTITEAGDLLRYFDGVFTTFDQDDGVPGRINTLQVEGDTLWLKTQEGLAFFHQGRVRPFYPQDVQGDVSAILSSRSGDLWIGPEFKGLYRVRADGDVQHLTAQDGLPNLMVGALHEDRNGVLWVGTRRQPETRAAPQEGGVYWFQGGRFEPVTQAGRHWSQQITMIFSDPDDAETLWFGSDEGEPRGWWSYRDGVLKPFPAVERGHAHYQRLKGPDGALWRTQGQWIYRDETPIFLAQDTKNFLRFDREGNLWVAGVGLHRLQRRALRTISEAEGIGRNLYPILEDRAGRIWLGSWSEPGLARIDGGAVTTYEVDSCCYVASRGSGWHALGGHH